MPVRQRLETAAIVGVIACLLLAGSSLTAARAALLQRFGWPGDWRRPTPTGMVAPFGVWTVPQWWEKTIAPQVGTHVSDLALSAAAAPSDAGGAWHVEVIGAVRYEGASDIPAGGDNYNGPPGPQLSRIVGELEVGLGTTLTPNVSIFALLKLESENIDAFEFGLERMYFNVRNALGVRGLDLRIGRDAITLGPIGLLLDGQFYEGDRRDGLQVWLPELGPLRIMLFGQFATDDWASGRYLAGGRAEIEVRPGWTLGFNVRTDIASDTGACPGANCNTGTGWGADIEGQVVPGVGLVFAYAAYTQTGDVARTHWQINLVLELEKLVGIRQFEPVVTLWHKQLDPYTIPGGPGGGMPRGAFWTPDAFNLFNINDNLRAFGVRLDAEAWGVELFVLGEWGTYRGGGASYRIVSAGVAKPLSPSMEVKLTYNSYAVGRGRVATSAISGIELGNTRLLQVEVEATW